MIWEVGDFGMDSFGMWYHGVTESQSVHRYGLMETQMMRY